MDYCLNINNPRCKYTTKYNISKHQPAFTIIFHQNFQQNQYASAIYTQQSFRATLPYPYAAQHLTHLFQPTDTATARPFSPSPAHSNHCTTQPIKPMHPKLKKKFLQTKPPHRPQHISQGGGYRIRQPSTCPPIRIPTIPTTTGHLHHRMNGINSTRCNDNLHK